MRCNHVYEKITPFISTCFICGKRKVYKKKVKAYQNGKAKLDS